jgi:protein arginine kinase activator
MSCDVCGSQEATVGYAEIVDGVLSTWRLCERCALARGIGSTMVPFVGPDPDVLIGLLEDESGESSNDVGECPACGQTSEGFRRAGRLGCAECYSVFRDELRPLIRRIHGTTEHIGCAPVGSGGLHDRKAELRRLRGELRAAVRKENFEQAAELRDSINELERKNSESGQSPGGD